jgi:hypothetical protein
MEISFDYTKLLTPAEVVEYGDILAAARNKLYAGRSNQLWVTDEKKRAEASKHAAVLAERQIQTRGAFLELLGVRQAFHANIFKPRTGVNVFTPGKNWLLKLKKSNYNERVEYQAHYNRVPMVPMQFAFLAQRLSQYGHRHLSDEVLTELGWDRRLELLEEWRKWSSEWEPTDYRWGAQTLFEWAADAYDEILKGTLLGKPPEIDGDPLPGVAKEGYVFLRHAPATITGNSLQTLGISGVHELTAEKADHPSVSFATRRPVIDYLRISLATFELNKRMLNPMTLEGVPVFPEKNQQLLRDFPLD